MQKPGIRILAHCGVGDHRNNDSSSSHKLWRTVRTVSGKAGGQYTYLKEIFGKRMGFLYGWGLFTVIQTGTIAAVAMALQFTAYYSFINDAALFSRVVNLKLLGYRFWQ